MKKISALAVLALLGTAALANPEERPPIVEYRHVQMEAMGKHMYSSKLIMKGQVDRKQDLVGHAQALHNISKGFTELFPEGTGPDKVKTDALSSIWDNFKGFEKANKTLVNETKKLIEVAETGDMDAYKKQFMQVGKSCGTCHDDYREDDD